MAQMDFDLFYSKLETKLKAYSAFQSSAYQFTVKKDEFNAQQAKTGAYIYLSFAGLQPTEEARNIWQHKATYNLDCIAVDKSSETATGDQLANARLRYLIGQCLEAILDPNDRDLGMIKGSLTGLTVERVTPFPDSIVTEFGIVGMRLVVSASFGWDATATGDPLTQLDVTTPNWAAVFDNE